MDAAAAARSKIDAVADDATSVVPMAPMRRGYQCILQTPYSVVRACRGHCQGAQMGHCTCHFLVALGRTRCSLGGTIFRPSDVAHPFAAGRYVPRNTSRPPLEQIRSDEEPRRGQHHGRTSGQMGRHSTESMQRAYQGLHAMASGCTGQTGVARTRRTVLTDVPTSTSGERSAPWAMDDMRHTTTLIALEKE